MYKALYIVATSLVLASPALANDEKVVNDQKCLQFFSQQAEKLQQCSYLAQNDPGFTARMMLPATPRGEVPRMMLPAPPNPWRVSG